MSDEFVELMEMALEMAGYIEGEWGLDPNDEDDVVNRVRAMATKRGLWPVVVVTDG